MVELASTPPRKMEIKKQILATLIESYLDKESFYNPAKSGRKIVLERKDSLFEPYRRGLEIEDEVRFLELKGFVFVTRHENSFTAIELNKDEKAIASIFEYLGIEDPRLDIARCLEILKANANQETVAGRFCQAMIPKMENVKPSTSKYFKDSYGLSNLLLAVKAVEELEKEMLFRTLSMTVFGNSKELEKLESPLSSVFRKYDEEPYEDDDDPLAAHCLVKNPTSVLVKGPICFTTFGQTIDLSSWVGAFSLNNDAVASFNPVALHAKKVVTIENLTSFTSFDDEDALVIYLSGFHDAIKKSLLQRIHTAFPATPFYHYGDMDAGGFYIFRRLCLDTGIPFVPYKMDIKAFEEALGYALPLSENDKKRLSLQLQSSDFAVFRDLIELMLQKNLKVEQESFLALAEK